MKISFGGWFEGMRPVGEKVRGWKKLKGLTNSGLTGRVFFRTPSGLSDANKLVTIYGAPPWRALTISVRDSSARAIQRAYRRWSRHPRVLSRLRRHGAPPSSRNVAVWRRRIVDRCDEAQLAVSALELQRRQTSRSLARGVERVDDALKALAILRRLGG